MRTLVLGCLITALAGCTQADKDAINAAFAPIDKAWREQADQNPLLGIDMALSGVVAGQQYRALKQIERNLAR
jgi:hypothetical protein